MDTKQPVDDSFVTRNVVLFPEQDNAVRQLATEMAEAPGRENFSQALRRIINEWAKARQSPPNNT